MSLEAVALAALEGLKRNGLDEAEVYCKRGRSRRLEYTPWGGTSQMSQEAGWAVRASDRHCSFFASGTGEPDPEGPWPRPDGYPLKLPDPSPVPPWKQPPDLETPLVGELEGFALLEAIERQLVAELPGARLLRAVLEDGSSACALVTSRGIKAGFLQRLAALRLEASAGGTQGGVRAAVSVAEREARRFRPVALGRRLADHLVVRQKGRSVERDRGEFLLAPPVGICLLAGLVPLWRGERARELAAALEDRRGRMGSERVTVVDDGRLEGGALEAPVDGEGVPTRAVTLCEGGIYRQPLLTWREVGDHSGRHSGCTRRFSWRDLPQPGPTHLYLKPQPDTPVRALLGSVARGYYLLDVTDRASIDLERRRFAVPVCGFALEGGVAAAPVTDVWLCGTLEALLRGIQAVARDLTFLPLDGMIGCPTLLLGGVELRRTV